MVKCTRWMELQATVESHARLAGILKAKTTFHLLNKPMEALQEFTVSTENDVEFAKTVISSTEPEGVTPLTQHILEIRERIAEMEEDLLANGQKVAVVIATDGIPSDEYGESPEEVRKAFIDALGALQLLPVWIVIRLCTNERKVRKFYHAIDMQLERPLDSVSSFTDEATEIRKWNSWLTYALPLHRIREMGDERRIFDLLDERELTKDELREFLDLLFGKSSLENAPNIHSDWKGFSSFLANVVRREGQQWCPHSKKMEYWIDLGRLHMIYGGGIVNSFRRRMSDIKVDLRELALSSNSLLEGTKRGDLLPASKNKGER